MDISRMICPSVPREQGTASPCLVLPCVKFSKALRDTFLTKFLRQKLKILGEILPEKPLCISEGQFQ